MGGSFTLDAEMLFDKGVITLWSPEGNDTERGNSVSSSAT